MESKRFLAVFLLFLSFVNLAGCGGGGGGANTTTSSGSEDTPNFDATAFDKEGLAVVMGSSSFQPPAKAVMLIKRPQSDNLLAKAQTMVSGVPWTSQVPPCASWYKTANCGPTSYLMIESFYKNSNLSSDNSEKNIMGVIDDLARYIPTYTPSSGNYYCGAVPHDNDLANLAVQRGGFAYAMAGVAESPDILLKELQKNHPVIVRVLTQGNNNSDEMMVEGRENFGHYMVVVGMDDTYIYVNDPGRGTEAYGKYKRYTLDSFKKAWATSNPQNRLILIYPKGEQLPVSIILQSIFLPNGKTGEQYNAVLSAINGKPPYTWSIKSGKLPTGLNLTQDGRIFGIPTQDGSFTFIIRVADSNNDVVERTITITTSSAIAYTPPYISVPRELPAGQEGVSYNISLSGAGGKWPYSWSIISGSLPNGLSLSQSGSITGMPSVAGKYNFTVQLADSSSPQKTFSKTLSITITAGSYSVSDLQGTWNMFSLSSGSDWNGWCHNKLNIDVNGNVMSDVKLCSDGSTTPQESGTYSISSSGNIGMSSRPSFHGFMDKSKDIFIGTSTAGNHYYLVLAQKSDPSLTYSMFDLAGQWNYHDIVSGSWNGWCYAQSSIDQTGQATATRICSSLSADNPTFSYPNGSSRTGSSLLSIDSNGIVTQSSNPSVYGFMNKGKDLIVMTATSGTEYGLMIIQKVNNMTYNAADLSGGWSVSNITSGPNWKGWYYGGANVDSSGNLSFSSILRSDGSTNVPSSTALSISQGGIISSGSNPNFHGFMSSGKDLSIIVQTDGSNNANLSVFQK